MNIFTHRSRYLSQGRQLMFGDDKITVIGPLWEYSTNLEYNIVSFKIYLWLKIEKTKLGKYFQINDTHIEAVSNALVSEPSLIIFPGMHFCDLLSPFRALEWVYIRGVQHGWEYSIFL